MNKLKADINRRLESYPYRNFGKSYEEPKGKGDAKRYKWLAALVATSKVFS